MVFTIQCISYNLSGMDNGGVTHPHKIIASFHPVHFSPLVGGGAESALPCACKHLAGKPRGLQGRGIRVSIKSTGPRTAGSGPCSSPAARAVLSEKFRFRKTGDKGVYFCGLTSDAGTRGLLLRSLSCELSWIESRCNQSFYIRTGKDKDPNFARGGSGWE